MKNAIEINQVPEYKYFHVLRRYLEQGFTTVLRRKLSLESDLNQNSPYWPAGSLADREQETPGIVRPLLIPSAMSKAPSVKVEPQRSAFPESEPVQEQRDSQQEQDSMKRLRPSSRTPPINCDKDSGRVNKRDNHDMRKRKKMRTERLLLGIMSAATTIHNQGLDSDGVEVKREPSARPSNGDFELVGNFTRLDGETRCPPHIAQRCGTCRRHGLEVRLSSPHGVHTLTIVSA